MSQDGDGSEESEAKPPPGDAKGGDKAAATSDDKASSTSDDKAASKSDDKAASKADDKAASKSDDKAASKSDDKAAKADTKPDAKLASKTDEKASSKTDDKASSKSDDKASDATSSTKSDDKPASKTDAKSSPKSDTKSDAKAATKSDDKPASKSDAKSDTKSGSKADAKSSSKSDDKPASKTDAKSGAKSGDKPASKADDKATYEITCPHCGSPASQHYHPAVIVLAILLFPIGLLFLLAPKVNRCTNAKCKLEWSANTTPPPKVAEQEAAVRPSASLLEIEAPMTFPDDGALSGIIRRLDNYLGICEQAVLFAILAAVVLTASANAILDKATGDTIWWSYDVIRGGTFAVAMMGAAFATHQSRHLAMDLISRSLPRRARLVLTALLEIFTITICCVLARSGLTQIDIAGEETGRHLVSARQIATFLPVGAGLIIVHSFLHLVIDIDYLMRGKLLPERARSGH